MTRATTLHRDRPNEDPAGAPSGMRWRPVFGGDVWMLLRDGWCNGSRSWLGSVCRTTDGRFVISRTEILPRGRARPRKTIRGAAKALVREVRRG